MKRKKTKSLKYTRTQLIFSQRSNVNNRSIEVNSDSPRFFPIKFNK